MSGRTPQRDFRQEVTNRVIEMLESGVAPWQKPWEAAPLAMPANVVTGKPYRGGNAFNLLSIAMERGYDDPRWMTFKQAADQGWHVKRGEHGSQIEFWEFKPAAPKDSTGPTEDGSDDPESDESRRRFIQRVYTVFNASQIEGIPPLPLEPRPDIEVIEAGERILKNSEAVIIHDQADRAYYTRARDEIHLPRREYFKDAPGYYGTALHELAHWTGHPARLNRLTLSRGYNFGDPEYAREELRAELTSLFLAAERGIPHDPSSHAAYVGSWIKALKDDKHEIFRAAQDAAAATDYLLKLERGQDLETPEGQEPDTYARHVRSPTLTSR